MTSIVNRLELLNRIQASGQPEKLNNDEILSNFQ